jgi:hypothetical protein
MKTPRELLLERHRSAEPRLDAIRHQVVGQVATPAETPSFAHVLASFFRMPRLLAGGLAAAWVLILGLQMASRETVPAAQVSPMARESRETLRALEEQRRLFAELVGPSERRADEDRFVPRPRSARRPEHVFA